MNYIYKISNLINNKVYIGLTTTSIETRWKNHIQSMKRGNDKHLYKAMRKYGLQNFIIEEIDSTDDFEVLGQLERKYIKEYESTNQEKGYNNTHGGESNQMDGNPRAKLTVADVENIRMIYNECIVGAKELWDTYKDRISYSAFEKVYEGITWKSIMPEVYTKENKIKHKQISGKSFSGERNPNAIYTNEEVLEIRKYYVNHSLSECYEKYGKKSGSKATFRAIIDRGYNNVPIYKKNAKKWINGDTNERIYSINDMNEIRIYDTYVEIDTYDCGGNKTGTFIVNKEYQDILKRQKWRCSSKGKNVYLIGRGGVNFLKYVYPEYRYYFFKDGNPFNLLKENVLSIEEYNELTLPKKVVEQKYKELDNNLLQTAKYFNVSRTKIKRILEG